MEESEDNMSAEEVKLDDVSQQNKSKKRSRVERQLETSLTARITSPLANGDASSTSRYGRARRLKSESELGDNVSKLYKLTKLDKSPNKVQSPAYKMHASNSPVRVETPKRDVTLENQIESIYNENVSLSRFNSEEKASKSVSKKQPKVYIRKDLIQSKDKEDDTVVLIKNMFSPSKSEKKATTHLTNYMERSSEKFDLKKPTSGYLDTSSVVKTLDFDGKKKKKEEKKTSLSKSELFDLEAQCEFQVGDLAWARMGTYPFWPCIVTRDPLSGIFVKKKLCGRIERDVLHVTFFGDNGRRGWIVGTMLRKFLGQLEFEVARTNFTPEAKKKDPRLYAAFLISDKKMPQWQVSVDEAEILLREPKRLRIDILYDMLQKGREIKTTPRHEKSKKIVRTNSDVSLSESLLDTLFSEDDSKGKDLERSRSKSGNRSLDVSDVVTACLDNMAAKTGITKIQRQSHMDRWLQKAKSKTPEKSHLQSHLSLKAEKDIKVSNTSKLKKKMPKKSPPNKPYSFRKYITESQHETENKLLSHQNEHDYSLRYQESNGPVILDDIEIEYENAEIFTSDVIEPGSGLGIITKVETLCDKESNNYEHNDVTMKVSEDNIAANQYIDDINQSCVQHNLNQTLQLKNKLVLKNENDPPSFSMDKSIIIEISNNIKPMNLDISETIDATNADEEKNIDVLSQGDTLSTFCTTKDSDCNDNKSTDECESNVQNPNNDSQMYDNVPVTFIDQNISLTDTAKYTKVSKDRQKVQTSRHVADSVMEQNHLNNSHDLTSRSLTSVDRVNNYDRHFLDQSIIEKGNVLKEKMFQNKTLESNNCTESQTTSPNVILFAVESTEDFPGVLTNLEDKNTKKACVLKENIQIKEQELRKYTENNTTNLSTQSFNSANVINIKEEYDGIENSPDLSKKNGGKSEATRDKETVTKKKSHQNSELVLNISSTENNTSNLNINSLNVSNVVTSKQYADDGIEDIPDLTLTAGEKNSLQNSVSASDIDQPCRVNQRQNDLKEFETQLYNIFGLSNKKLPKSKFKLSLNKTCNAILSKHNDETECSESIVLKHDNNRINDKDKYTNSLVSKIEVGTMEREIFTKSGQSGNLNLDINISRRNNLPQMKTLENLGNEHKVISTRASIETFDGDTNSTDDNDESLAEIQLRLKSYARKSSIESDAEKKMAYSKDAMINKDNNEEIKDDQVNYKDSEMSLQKTELPADHKLSKDAISALKNPEFLKYLELKQDALIDEQPEFSKVEVTNYLYKTWLYEESLKSDIQKTDDIQNARLVNGLKQSPIKIKLSLNRSSKKSKKSYMVQITNDNENYQNSVTISDKKNDITTFNSIHLKKNDCVSIVDSSPKRSKRIKRKSQYSTHLEKYLNVRVEKLNNRDSYCNKVVEPKECGDIGSDICSIHIQTKDNKEDVTCKDFATVSGKSSIKNGYKADQTEKQLHSYDKAESVKNVISKVSKLVTQNCSNGGKLRPEKTLLDDFDPDSNPVSDDDKPLVKHQLRLTLTKNQSAYVADGEINTKEDNYEAEKDDTDISFKSEDSEISCNNKKIGTHKLFYNTKEALMNQDFVKYLELKQDTLIDENPELTEGEITNYLYKTWLYEESLKNDIKKADDIETVTNLVKGLNHDTAPVKRVRKKKVEKDKQIDFIINSEDIAPKEKSKRKIVKQYFYKENFSDIEDDIEFFEIFNTKSKPVKALMGPITIENSGTEEESSNIQTIDEEGECAIDEVEEYFRQLTVPKPNIFKGLLREKVCEICEQVDNLIKCKGCYCMFHAFCVKNKTNEVVEVASNIRGRKKKKRGRKPKDHANSLDSECQSDEKSQDANASDEMINTSIDNDVEPYIIANAEDFEAQLSMKMKELIENPENNMENDSYSSAEELDWNDIEYGECKVVDVLPRKKDRGNDIDYSNFKCNNCQKYETPVCFVCKSAVSPKNKAEHRQRCQVAHCHKYYHLECLDHWPQTQFNAGELSRISNSKQLVEALSCPRHVCHTCVCDDPRGCKTRFSGDKLARCVRCPATYHTFTKCLPAGSQILTASHIICPRHYEHRPGTQPRHVNTGWCFICALGGTLICCEYCPTSFHAECLNIDPPEGGYMCEDCETGRLPLYGEMVWVKLGHYRWWPGMILHPSEIPLNILTVKHSQGEFVVRFFGQYDYYWVNRGRVFPFQEGDSGRISGQKSKIDAAFMMAMEHAQRACQVLKTVSPNEVESMDIASSLLPPHYVKLKVNKPCGSLCGKKIDIEESSLTQCECDPNEVDPCGPYTQCLNRMLLTECGPTCRAGDRCNNRAFEKRLYPKMTPYRTPHSRGWGLKTLEDIRAGQFVIEYVGELIDEEEFQRRMRRKQEVRDENFYYLTLDKERMIDAGPKGNLARFMNHSCEPNCETQKWTVLGDVRVGLFALYDIPAQSELTFNYNLESTGIEKKQCMCGAKRCSGYIGEKPKQDDQPKKTKPALQTKRTYKKRKNTELSPPTKPKQRVGRPHKPRELTDIEKDLLIIKNATNGMSSDSESSSRLSNDSKDSKGLKRRRIDDNMSPSTKKFKTEKPVNILQETRDKYQEVLT